MLKIKNFQIAFLLRGNLNEVSQENDVVYKSRPFKNGIKQKKHFANGN